MGIYLNFIWDFYNMIVDEYDFFFYWLDLDECKMDFDDCDSNVVCINKYGLFGCKCKVGYNGYLE